MSRNETRKLIRMIKTIITQAKSGIESCKPVSPDTLPFLAYWRGQIDGLEVVLEELENDVASRSNSQG